MKYLLTLAFALFMCAPKMSLNLGHFDWVSPTGQERAVRVELYNDGENERGIRLEPEQVRGLLNHAWTSCDGMVGCDPLTREAFVVVDPLEWWLIFYVEDKGI